jgi:Mg2+ and Co2+ transporter CorA
VHPIFLDEDVGKILKEKATASASTSGKVSAWRANQNVQHLARDYALLLDKNVMAQDSFYALSNTLRVSAASINQFLNLAAHLISEGSDESKGAGLKAPPMQQARTLQEVLSRTKRDLSRTVNFLSNRELLQWPQAHNEDARARADRMASLLKMDFTDLSERANQLSADIQEWIDWLAQNATQSTANASQDSAQRTQKLTILAFMFVPVSTVCAFFGMNFEFVNEAPPMSFGIGLVVTLIVSVIVWYALRLIMPLWASMKRVIYERYKQIRGGKKDE